MRNQALKAVMVLNGDRQEDLAEALKIQPSTLSKKINGVVTFTQPEIEKITLRYNLAAEEIQKIFFANTVNQ